VNDQLARVDIGSVLASPERCAGCGSRQLVAVTNGEQAAFMCQSCGQCWQVELGWAHRVSRPGLRRPAGLPRDLAGPAARSDPAPSQAEATLRPAPG
jgi:hypothetical protein